MSDTLSRAYTPSMQFLDENGKPIVYGFLCTYRAGTNTPIATFNDNGQANPVRIPLNELGSPENGVQLDVAKEYKFVLLREDGTTVWTKDHVKAAGVGDITVEGLTEIVASTPNVHVTMSLDGQKAYIGVSESTAFITTQTTLAQARSILDNGGSPVLRYEFAEDDVWFLALREDDRDGNYMIFSGPTSTSGVFAYAQLYSSGWTMPRTYGLASQESLQSERQTRAAADADLQEQIDNVQIDVDDSLSTDSTNPVENRVVTGAVNSKQDQIPQEQLDEMTDQEIDDLMASLN